MKDVGDWIGLVPALREPGLQFVTCVLLDERVEDEHVDALGLRVDADPGVKARRA